MAYITSDGRILSERNLPRIRNPFRKLMDAFLELPPKWKAVAVACFALACRHWLHSNPLANGKIPAAALNPDQHWKRIWKDDFFVRSMTEHLGKKTHWQGKVVQMQNSIHKHNDDNANLEKIDIDRIFHLVDFGGPDGHVLEKGDWSDLKYVRGTRCSTTRSAITAYFCGASVAENQDLALGSQRKGYYSGVQAFANFLSCRHQQGQRANGNHRRSVYRIGIGCQDALAGYSHAFSIVAQPDGTFFWLQSFVTHYSLSDWMSKSNADGTPKAHLSLDNLLAKLAQVERLMDITGWTAQANRDYYELFGVDMDDKAYRRSKPPLRTTWKHTHRLEAFHWDEACEYPVPSDLDTTSGSQQPLTSDKEGTTKAKAGEYDECFYKNLLEQLRTRMAF